MTRAGARYNVGQFQGVRVMRSGRRRVVGLVALAAMLASCGGGDGGGSGGSGFGGSTGTAPTPSPSPSPSSSGSCSLRARQDWVLAQMREWYLFPDTLPASIDPSRYGDVDTFLDALTATARAQNKDRYFTYLTSVKEENAYYGSGTTAGFGVRLTLDRSNRLLVTESFEGGPALAANVDRGAQIDAVGTSSSNLQTVSSLLSSGNTDALNDALGPDTPGTTRVFRVIDTSGTRVVTLSKADFSLAPVSPRYGYKVIDDGGRKVGYVNLRTFISTADDQLRTAFGAFRAQGITNVIVDLRYNGGGLLATAETFTDLLGGARSTSDVQTYIAFRPSKSSNDETIYFGREANAITPTKVAFIGTEGTASASEYVINAMIPYLHGNAALIGSNTYGKPVGQIPLDNPACPDDRLRVIALALQNAARQGDYYNGLAGKVEASCQASDDLTRPLGDANEASVRTALNYLGGRGCTPIGASASAQRTAGLTAQARTLLTPARPHAAQRETPGLY